jgi:hypothetical protein
MDVVVWLRSLGRYEAAFRENEIDENNEAEGDVARFGALLAEYVKAPEVTRRQRLSPDRSAGTTLPFGVMGQAAL